MVDDVDIIKFLFEDCLGYKVDKFCVLFKFNILEMIGKFRVYVKMVFLFFRCGK